MWWQSIIDVGSIYFKMLSVSEVWRYMMGTAQIHSGQRLQSAFSSSKPWFPSKGNSLCKPRDLQRIPWMPGHTAKHISPQHTIYTAFPMALRVSPYHMGHVDTEFGNKMLLRRLDLGFKYAFGVCYQVLNLFIKKNLIKNLIYERHSTVPQKNLWGRLYKGHFHHLKVVTT